ncbi:Deoxyribodipyrimidine photo-lyase [Buchnera aphidicola (Protaphis terricola)]|uniref:deoxyribodipyrimidine photo-lyase n=1 Tax=Buchnera aphidicola TaxID=9 RepID=UPI0034648C96
MSKNLVWFRNDIRIYDNKALYNACLSDTDEVIGLFIFTKKQWNDHFMSMKKLSFLYQNVIFLQNELLKLNIVLYHYECADFFQSIEYLLYFCKIHKINNLFYNYQYEINEKNRDILITQKLSLQGTFIKAFHSNILVSPDKIKNKNKMSYRKFYFFKKKIINYLSNKIPTCYPIPKKRIFIRNTCKIDYIQSYLIQFDQNLFPIGEINAKNQLKYFCTYKLKDYLLKKNFPFYTNTSMLSPYLSLGIISPKYCLEVLLKEYKTVTLNIILNSPWLNEIIWREFYYHLLIGFPIISKSQSLFSWEKKITWEDNINYFNAWKNGKTGFPIIDAGMRQLNKTGWINNRLRMITSSFLVKSLLINWREGEKYFMSHLIDGDYALNNGGWQWSASIGSDSNPYIRIFNPLRQSKFFDKLGNFIRKYLPELKNIPNPYIHNPYEWIIKQNYKINYPKPIINFQNNREKFLLMYHMAKSPIN